MICLGGIFIFGNNLASIFEKNNVANLSSSSRTSKSVDNSVYLSQSQIEISGSKADIRFKSPVETVIRSEMLNNTVQTSGSSGNITETVAVAQEYINQLNSLLQNQPQSNALIDSLSAYNSATQAYISQNGAEATDPLLKQINAIKFAISLNNQGTLAQSLSSNA